MTTYFIQIECDKDFSNIDNIHSTPKKELTSIIDKLETMSGKEYFKTYETKIKKAIELLKSIFDEIDKNYNIIELEEKLKNIIASELSTYNLKIEEVASTQERDQRDFSLRRADFIANIIEAIKKMKI